MHPRRLAATSCLTLLLAAAPVAAQQAGGPKVYKITPDQGAVETYPGRQALPAQTGGGAPAEAPAPQQAVTPQGQLPILMFYTPDCPHCKRAFSFFDAQRQAGKHVLLQPIDVSTADGQRQFAEFRQSRHLGSLGVPTFVVGERHMTGFNDTLGRQLMMMSAGQP